MNPSVSQADHSGRGIPPASQPIVGAKPASLSIAGTIRPGIKVLTRKAVDARPDALAIYKAGVARGDTFDMIDAELRKRCGFEKSPLTPRNVPYFRVARADFTFPEAADAILSQYGEDRGEGRQLYRLPVILPFDEPLKNIPHKMAAYNASTIRYWSEYTDSGHRVCLKYAPATPNPMNRRAKRTFGGRAAMLNREWNDQGLCDPNTCPVYQAGECALKGKILFWIPGIAGSSLFEIPTGSWYSLEQVLSSMRMVLEARGGRITGMHQGRPLFYLTKVQEEVSRIDEHGQSTRQMQYLIYLEAAVDMGDVLNAREAMVRIPIHELPAPDGEPEERGAANDESAGAGATSTKPALAPEIVKARRDLFARVLAMAINVDQFTTRCTTEWGEGWGVDAASLAKALAVLPAHGTPEEFAEFNRWMDTPF